MKTLPLRGVRDALVVAPHPDDETIGAFGLIRALRRRGARVRVVVVTDGRGSHRLSRRWPPERLQAARRAETLRAMRRSGVTAPLTRFLNFPDSGLARLSPADRRQLGRRLAEGPRPDLLVLPSPDDYHADHRVVAEVAAAAWPPAVRRISYLVWPKAGYSPRGRRYALPLGRLQAAKRGAIRGYRTQTGLIDDDPTGFRMGPDLVGRFSGPCEIFGDDS